MLADYAGVDPNHLYFRWQSMARYDVRIFLTGGTGTIGGHAVPALVSAGHSVSALARSDAKADELRRHGATPVDVSIFDRDALASAFAGHDAVINLATALPPTRAAIRRSAWAPCERLRSEGSAAVVDAALTADVGHLMQESVVMIYADGGNAWLDEHARVDHYPMARGNHAAESSARRFAETGSAATILRFGLFYGPGSAQSAEILAMARRHIGFMPGPPSAYLSSIHLADAAAAVVACRADAVASGEQRPPARGHDVAAPLSERAGGLPRDGGRLSRRPRRFG